MRDNKTGGDARLVFAGQTQRTAAMSPRFLGGAGGKIPPGPFFPTAFFGKKAVPRPGRPAAAQAPPWGDPPLADYFPTNLWASLTARSTALRMF